MRVVGSSLDYRNDPHGPQIERLTKIFRECAKMAADEGVKLADENHFDFTVDEYLGLLDAVGSPGLRPVLRHGQLPQERR